MSDLKTKIKTAKSNYLTKTLPFLKHSPSKFWSYLKPAKNNRSNTPQEKDKPVTADKLNSYFKSVFTVDDGNIPDIVTSAEGTLDTIVVNEAGVVNLLLNLDTQKSAWSDNIPNIFLVMYAELLAKYLCVIFHKSLSTCSLPVEWNKAKVVPVHKEKSGNDISNFKPISLTCTICKILEYIIL